MSSEKIKVLARGWKSVRSWLRRHGLAPFGFLQEVPTDSDEKEPWNRCFNCGELVDCDDVCDGSEVWCRSCERLNVVVEWAGGSFGLVTAERDSDAGEADTGDEGEGL